MDDPELVHQLACIVGKTTVDVEGVIHALKHDSREDDIVSKVKGRVNDRIETGELVIDTPGSMMKSTVNVRVGQRIFRHNLDVVFDGRCCLTGIAERSLIRASHIVPWVDSDPYMKTDPRNGLLLNGFHDLLFDKHLMTVYHDGDVEYSDSLRDSLGSVYDGMCRGYRHIDWPEGYRPSKVALEIHNDMFQGRVG